MRAILFDLDGTLVDTRADLWRSVNHALKTLGRPERSLEEVTGFIGDGVGNLLTRSLGPDQEALRGRAVALFKEHYFAHCADEAALFPGVMDALKRFQSRTLAVVTNKPETPSRVILDKLGIASFFKVLLAGDKAAALKPSPEPLLQALNALRAAPSEALMVGDSPMDVEAGKAAGMRTCAVTYGYRPRQALAAARPDFMLDDLSGLGEILKEVP